MSTASYSFLFSVEGVWEWWVRKNDTAFCIECHVALTTVRTSFLHDIYAGLAASGRDFVRWCSRIPQSLYCLYSANNRGRAQPRVLRKSFRKFLRVYRLSIKKDVASTVLVTIRACTQKPCMDEVNAHPLLIDRNCTLYPTVCLRGAVY